MSGSVMEPLRCWARWDGTTDHGEESLYCEDGAGHVGPCHARHGAYVWASLRCAPDHGPAGRLSVAHRLRELSWRADLLAFRSYSHSEWAGVLAAMAARLLVDAQAAKADLKHLEAEIASAETISDMLRRDLIEPMASDVDALLAILCAAADLLRPFAEGV